VFNYVHGVISLLSLIAAAAAALRLMTSVVSDLSAGLARDAMALKFLQIKFKHDPSLAGYATVKRTTAESHVIIRGT